MMKLSPADEQLLSLFESGQIGQAMQLATRRVQQDPGAVVAWRVIGHIKLFQGLAGEALMGAERALAVVPGDPESILLGASALGAMGRTAEAIARCDAILAADPQHAEAAIAKGRFLERAGQTAEAQAVVAALPRPLSPAALLVEARSLLRQDQPEGALESVSAALADEGVPLRRRYNLQMLRARALDRLGRYDEAFAAAAEGNALVADSAYDVARFGDMVDAVIETFSAENIERFARNTASSTPHVFISGFPRTGTTLIEQILDAHPAATGVGEAKEIDVAARSLQQHTGAFVAYPACAEFATEPLLAQIARAYEDAMVARGFPAGGVYVNKNLQNLTHTGLISMLFPASKIVLTRRDPRDTAVSCFMGAFRVEAMPHLFSMDDIARAIAHADRLTAHWERVFPDRTLTVRYEDMVGDHSVWVPRLVGFAGLPWDERCLRFFESGRTVMTLAYDQVSRPIYHSSVGRYKNYQAHLGSELGDVEYPVG